MVSINTLDRLLARAESALKDGECPALPEAEIEAVTRAVPSLSSAPLILQRAGIRLWEVCRAASAIPTSSKADLAAARELACELVETGLAQTGSGDADARFNLILQWAVSGKTFIDLASYAAAVRCLNRSAMARDTYMQELATEGKADDWEETIPTRLGEASMQTQLWLATAFSQLNRFDEALVALSKAAFQLKDSPELADISRPLLLKACSEQASLLRAAKEPRLEADALGLAAKLLESLGSSGHATDFDKERAEILRQLSQCHTDLEDRDSAVANAREALQLDALGSSGQAKSLRSLLKALLAPPRAPKADEEPNAKRRCLEGDAANLSDVALDFISHARAKLGPCLAACQELAEAGYDKLCLECLSRLRSRLDPEGAVQAWLLEAQLLAGRIEDTTQGPGGTAGPGGPGGVDTENLKVEQLGRLGLESAADRFCELLNEVEALPRGTGTASLGRHLCDLLCSLAEAICKKGQPQASILWLRRALPFLEREGSLAFGFRALALCNHEAGDMEQAKQYAEASFRGKGDGNAATLLLLDAARRRDVEAFELTLKRIAGAEALSEPPLASLSLPQASFLVERQCSGNPAATVAAPLLLRSLELLFAAALQEPSGGISPADVLRRMVEVSLAIHEDFPKQAERFVVAAELPNATADELGWFLEKAWQRAIGSTEDLKWAAAVAFFETAHRLLAAMGSNGSAGRDAARCAAAAAQALLQQASELELQEGSESDVQALLRRALAWAVRGSTAFKASFSHEPEVDRHFARLRLQAAARLGAVSQAVSLVEAAAGDFKAAAFLARFAMELGEASLTTACLRMFLRLAGSGGAPSRLLAAGCRALLEQRLHDPTVGEDLCLACCEALELQGAGAAKEGASEEELLWLSAVTWNSGADAEASHLASKQMELGLQLLQAINQRSSAQGLKQLEQKLLSWEGRVCARFSPS